MEASDNDIVTEQEQTTPTGETQQPEPEIDTDQHTDSWGETDPEKQDMEWDGGALGELRNRSMEAITVIESDDGEGKTDDIS